ncbi:M61 family metallopeptidase [Lysobacter sp. CA199]|uniref:M61 family metallopeptidase n=1 Tax=Lysobacter sp. CA199 TaxID=3455608 RepID=UPI003F8D1B88
MAARVLPLPTLLLCAALAATAAPACAQAAADTANNKHLAIGADERVIRAGDTRLRVIVENPGDRERADELHRWLDECAQAALTAFGHFPLREATVRIRLVPRRGRDSSRDSSPVPWGQTRRGDGVAVLLYVRDDASLAELRADWTAVHELSHLFHPYLGDQGRWLAEGLASYYQNVLRARAGLLDADEAWRRLDGGFQRGRAVGAGRRMDQVGWSRGSTMRIYWAGAAYWLDADLALRRERGTTLEHVLGRYSDCCLDGDEHLEPRAFVDALDRAGGRGVFARLYRRYAAMTEFPPLDAAYRELGLSTADGALRLSADADAARLRRAIMSAPRRDPSPRGRGD